MKLNVGDSHKHLSSAGVSEVMMDELNSEELLENRTETRPEMYI
jgi:hypothetical protein